MNDFGSVEVVSRYIVVILISSLLLSGSVHAQENIPKVNSAFYFLDTSRTIPTDKLWHTYQEGLVKFYTLNIYAVYVELMDRPTFGYSSRYQQPVLLSEDQFKSIKLSSLSELILKLKQFAEEDRTLKNDVKRRFYLYIIERKSNGYVMVKTQLDGSGPRRTVY